jgi:adenosylmethionine-8-amino-7-oxononanoate aminotransferase
MAASAPFFVAPIQENAMSAIASPARQQPRADRRRLAGRALDALHRQPPVQGDPRMVVAARAYYTDGEGRKIFDGLSGLWCSGLGHGRREIAEAWASRPRAGLRAGFQFGHPLSFELANRIKQLTPAGLDYVFFTGSARRPPTPR